MPKTDNRHLYDNRYFRASKYFQLDQGRINLFKAVIKKHNPKTVLDVGCGLGKLVKDLNAEGISAKGIDFSRVLERDFWGGDKNFKTADARNIPYPDQSFDLVFSSDFFEHVHKEDIPTVVSEMRRVGKKVLSEVAFAGQGHLKGDQDKYHLTHEPRAWWERTLEGVEMLNFEKVELGVGKKPHKGFITVDVEEYAKPDILADFRELTFHKIQVLRAHHLLEHFSRAEGIEVLKMWHRWLDMNGTLIVETPDFEGICENFAKDKYWMTRHAYGSQEADWAFHKDGWYAEKFREELFKIGFTVDSVVKGVSRKILPNITVTARKTKQ